MPPITQRYLIAVGVESFVDAAGHRYLDSLWYKDLIEHFRYLQNVTLALPCRWHDPPQGAIRIDNDPGFASVKFVDLPAPANAVQAMIELPALVRTLWNTIGNSEIIHTAVGGWPLPLGWVAVPIALIRKKMIVIVVESAFWRLSTSEVNPSVRARLRAYLSEAINRWCLNKSDLSIFTQPEYKRELLTKQEDRGHVISASWVDEDKLISDAEAIDTWRSKSGLDRPLNALFAGRLVPDKGILVLLAAIKQLDDESIPIELDILGTGDLAAACVEVSQEMKKARICLLGTVPYDELFELLRRYHAIIVPSLSDEQPRIVYDAFSQAVPALASDTPGLRSCVEHGKTGMLVRPGDPAILADLLKHAQSDIGALETMGLAALTMARSQTHRLMHEKRWALLLKLLSSPRSHKHLVDRQKPIRPSAAAFEELFPVFADHGLTTEVSAIRPTADSLIPDRKLSFIVGRGRDRAVLLLAPAQFPDVVADEQDKMDRMRLHLGEDLGSVIPRPLATGYFQGRSYSLTRMLPRISESYFLQKKHVREIREPLFDWLQKINDRSNLISDPAEFERPLLHLRQHGPAEIQFAVSFALDRLKSGRMAPRSVPMHGDLWLGNVVRSRHTEYPFAIIDWGGSKIDGFPVFDMLRASMSLRLPRAELKSQILRVADALECEPADATTYVVAALGEIAMRSDCFPFPAFLRLSLDCLSEMKRTFP